MLIFKWVLFIPNNIKFIRTDFNYRLFYIMYIIFKCFILHEYNKYNNSHKVILKYFLYVPVLYLRARLYCSLLFFHAMSSYFLLQFFLSTMASRLRLTGLLHPFHELRVFFAGSPYPVNECPVVRSHFASLRLLEFPSPASRRSPPSFHSRPRPGDSPFDEVLL